MVRCEFFTSLEPRGRGTATLTLSIQGQGYRIWHGRHRFTSPLRGESLPSGIDPRVGAQRRVRGAMLQDARYPSIAPLTLALPSRWRSWRRYPLP